VALDQLFQAPPPPSNGLLAWAASPLQYLNDKISDVQMTHGFSVSVSSSVCQFVSLSVRQFVSLSVCQFVRP
jgi:hypothetical protein